MFEKKHLEKNKVAASLEKVTTEIIVANERSFEPFIKVFNYSGENVTTNSLGTLVGIFTVDEHSEDSAYIVNFLASVAKKEYFNNTRRGAIESFEAALHKINVALAELVKHGNIAWLGKLHGVLGVFEKNNFHFSVTGEAKILLLRSGTLSEISIGLASEESTLHPIKTFVEIASGRLMLSDKVILTSPELFTLLSLEDLKKNMLRMDNDRFTQFLRTVLVNELTMAGTTIIDMYTATPAVLPKTHEIPPLNTIHNAFSQQTFAPKITTPAIHPEEHDKKHEVPPSEYVDSKTGHIYIQGDTAETSSSPKFERTKMFFQDVSHNITLFISSQTKFLHKWKKWGAGIWSTLLWQGALLRRKILRYIRKQYIKAIAIRLPNKTDVPSTTSQPITPTREKEKGNNTDIPLFMQAKLAAFYEKNPTPVPDTPHRRFRLSHWSWQPYSTNILSRVRRVFLAMQSLLRYQKSRFFIGIGVLFLLTLSVFVWMRSGDETPPDTNTPPRENADATVFPLDTEKNARVFDAPITITTLEDRIITAVFLDDEMFLITTKGVYDMRDKKQYVIPAGNGESQFATPMDDLRLIFIYTDQKQLFAWSPISRTFIKNTLTLP
ncbi:MAG TPA: hypothetical protein VJH89_00390, partial [Patescibacteria group bacterium]|nr:hypothetical protein [Patescibacteria group bacterium]